MTARGVRVVAALCAAVVLGCGHPSNVLERTDSPESTRVIIHASSPIRYGKVVTRTEGLILHVQVELENTSRSDQTFEYRWEWTDAGGFQLGDTVSSWQPAFIGGKDRKLMNAAGPGPSAVNFRLYVRKPEN